MPQTLQLVDFLKTFPKDSNPRPQQEFALKKIANAFSSGKKFVIASLPTGSGKSHIASSIARSATPIDSRRKELVESYAIYKKDKNGNYQYEDDFLLGDSFGSYILTVTKSLQDQYRGLFENSIVMKGKSNYACDIDPNVSIDFAPCLFSQKIKDGCFAANRCPYYKTRNNAFTSLDPILNYRSFMNLPRFLRKREIYIFDEAGELESELVGQYSITINYANLSSENIDYKKLYSDNNKEAGAWLNDVYTKVKSESEKLKTKLSNIEKNESYEAVKNRDAQRLGRLMAMVHSLETIIPFWEECEYLVETRDSEKVVLVPYDIKPLAQMLFDGADMIVMMSATISNPLEFAKTLGIQEGQYEYIDIPSSFDSKKSPIKISRKYSLSYKNNNRDLPKIIEATLELCKQHKGHKGIIHTHTNKITEELKKKVGKDKRFLFRELGKNNEYIIEEHKNRIDDDTILVSPSLDTGISLDGDLGRFQIILKAPFLPLNSTRIKKIYDKNKTYYMMKMLDSLVQMCGRCTRSEHDHSITYILDGNVFPSIVSNKHLLPKHFLERLI